MAGPAHTRPLETRLAPPGNCGSPQLFLYARVRTSISRGLKIGLSERRLPGWFRQTPRHGRHRRRSLTPSNVKRSGLWSGARHETPVHASWPVSRHRWSTLSVVGE